MRKHKIGNQKYGYTEHAFTAEEEAAEDEKEQGRELRAKKIGHERELSRLKSSLSFEHLKNAILSSSGLSVLRDIGEAIENEEEAIENEEKIATEIERVAKLTPEEIEAERIEAIIEGHEENAKANYTGTNKDYWRKPGTDHCWYFSVKTYAYNGGSYTTTYEYCFDEDGANYIGNTRVNH